MVSSALAGEVFSRCQFATLDSPVAARVRVASGRAHGVVKG